MSTLIEQISDDQFEASVLKSDIPVLVDFWAEWCGPCKMVAPVLEQIAQDYQGKIKIVKVNVDDHQHRAAEYGVRGIPTLLLFKNGALLKTQVGALNKTQLCQIIDQTIA